MKLSRWIKIILLIYALLGIAIFYLQDKFLFHPEPLLKTDTYNFSLPHKEINIPFDKESNLNIIQFIADSSQGNKGVILYFHGNRKNISWYAKYVPSLTAKGYQVWMIDYPGFGKSTGPLTEERLYEYADQLFRLAKRSYSGDSIILYGKSMGTGIAAQVAATHHAKLLLLETPYYSIHSLFSYYLPFYPIGRMIHYELPTYKYLPEVLMPVIIFQGTDDGVVPYRNAKKLIPLMKPKDRFITIEGGTHNDLTTYPEYRRVVDSVLGGGNRQ